MPELTDLSVKLEQAINGLALGDPDTIRQQALDTRLALEALGQVVSQGHKPEASRLAELELLFNRYHELLARHQGRCHSGLEVLGIASPTYQVPGYQINGFGSNGDQIR